MGVGRLPRRAGKADDRGRVLIDQVGLTAVLQAAVGERQVQIAIAVGVAGGHSIGRFRVQIGRQLRLPAEIVLRAEPQDAAVVFIDLVLASPAAAAIVSGDQIQIAVAIPVGPGQPGGLVQRRRGGGVTIPNQPRATVLILPQFQQPIGHVPVIAAPGGQVEVAIAVPVAPGNGLDWRDRVRAPTHLPLRIELQRTADVLIQLQGVAIVVVAKGQVEVAVAVPVAPGQAGRLVRLRRFPADTVGRVKLQCATDILVDLVGRALIAIGQVEVAIAVPVAPAGAARHVAFGRRPAPALFPGRIAQHTSHVFVDLVGLRPACLAAVGHRHVKVAVAVHVAPGHAARVGTVGRFVGDVADCEAAAAVIDVDLVSGVIGRVVEPADPLRIDTVADIEVEIAVPLDVAPGHSLTVADIAAGKQ